MPGPIKLHWLIATGVLALVSSVLIYWAPSPNSTSPAIPQTGTRLAPDFSLASMDGRSVSLNDWRGHLRLLNFWATWCMPCREEMPEIESAYQAWREQGFVVLSINESDDWDSIQEVIQIAHPTFPVLLDRDGTVAKNYRVAGLPTSVFIDHDGVARIVKVGSMDFGYIESQLVALGLSPTRRPTALSTAPSTAESDLTPTVNPTATQALVVPSSRLDMDALYPLGEGRDLVLEICASCHGIVPVAIVRRQMGGWASNRATHEQEGLLDGLSTAQIDSMYRYLNEFRNRNVPRAKIPQELLLECDG